MTAKCRSWWKKIDEQDSVILNSTLTSPKTIIETPTESLVDSLHENSRKRQDLSLAFNNQDNEFDNFYKINLYTITVNRNPSSIYELANKKEVDDSVGESTIVKLNQTLQNYLKTSVGNDTYNLTKYDKIQITDTTIIKHPKSCGYPIKSWVIKCENKNTKSRRKKFKKSTETNSLTGHSGAIKLPPFGKSFMYIETSSGNHGNGVFVSFERTDTVHITYIAFYYNRFSSLNKDILKSKGWLRIQLLLADKT